MASFHTHAIFISAIVLILQPWCAARNIFSPIFDALCDKMECGKGTCKRSQNSTLGFVCECDDGWKQASLPLFHVDDLKFLPCVVPNSCHWIDCGGGTCNRTSFFKYSCECEEGYYNLHNHTGLPCYNDCALGNNCSKLGNELPDSSQQSSAATCRDKGDAKWLIISTLFSVLGIVGVVI
ncbi:uncharacterized protein [Coffea arabica]|uniref:Uncharacterized protein n=1 Tax=Coffea arabica TaxID=13443 RepID=A0A6P6WU24_COFAR|nr:adhesive plaque matrix protein 2-like [Coffea arabica]